MCDVTRHSPAVGGWVSGYETGVKAACVQSKLLDALSLVLQDPVPSVHWLNEVVWLGS